MGAQSYTKQEPEELMSDTIQKYKDYVMTGFMKSVAPIVIDRASGTLGRHRTRVPRLLFGDFGSQRGP